MQVDTSCTDTRDRTLLFGRVDAMSSSFSPSGRELDYVESGVEELS